MTDRVERMKRIPPMPKTEDRRPWDDDCPDGYLESDVDWARNNPEAITWLADNHEAIRAALTTTPQEAAKVLLGEFEDGGKVAFRTPRYDMEFREGHMGLYPDRFGEFVKIDDVYNVLRAISEESHE